METLVLTVHVVACLFLIVVVLLQTGQEGMGVIFGGSSGSMFGSSGAGGLLVKVTTALAVIFLVTSLAYNLLAGKPRVHGDSIMLNAK
ncbi:MAG: preprotein translocase subunit SecG, partial [Desulfovibrionaceae bacterium]|nr:preprotein translocase subunit SecG [Desulfovibrionaceae bacterium]